MVHRIRRFGIGDRIALPDEFGNVIWTGNVLSEGSDDFGEYKIVKVKWSRDMDEQGKTRKLHAEQFNMIKRFTWD